MKVYLLWSHEWGSDVLGVYDTMYLAEKEHLKFKLRGNARAVMYIQEVEVQTTDNKD